MQVIGRFLVKKICPNCQREYLEIDNYCTRCGVELVKERNRCSENRTPLCKGKTFAEDDVYCSICGAPTTYGKALIDELKDW